MKKFILVILISSASHIFSLDDKISSTLETSLQELNNNIITNRAQYNNICKINDTKKEKMGLSDEIAEKLENKIKLLENQKRALEYLRLHSENFEIKLKNLNKFLENIQNEKVLTCLIKLLDNYELNKLQLRGLAQLKVQNKYGDMPKNLSQTVIESMKTLHDLIIKQINNMLKNNAKDNNCIIP